MPVNAQIVNLVPNHSFEEFENGCPENFNDMPVHWKRWRESANTFSTCVTPETFVDSLGWAPLNGFGHKFPYDGNSYVGLMAFGPSVDQDVEPDFREYLGAELLETLDPGTEYFVRLRASLALNGFYWYMSLASSHLGSIFTTEAHHYQQNPMPIPNYGHVYTSDVLAEYNEWVTIEGSFIADSAYTHIGLGVFFDFELIEYSELLPGPSLGSYYYIDDVCVSRFPNCLNPTTDISESISNLGLRVFPNPASDLLRIESSYFMEKVNLFALDGSLIFSQAMQGSTQWSLNISGISSGIYILEVSSNKGTKREKLVVAR